MRGSLPAYSFGVASVFDQPTRWNALLPVIRVPTTNDQQQKTKNQQLRTKNQKPRTKNQEPVTVYLYYWPNSGNGLGYQPLNDKDGGTKLVNIPTPTLREGAFDDRFEVRRPLGAGGFGDVYEVLDRERRDVVAIKVLHETRASTLLRFKKEFRSLTRLSHPNLVQLYELLNDGDDWLFAMELVHGQHFLKYVRGVDAETEARTREFGSVSIADIETLEDDGSRITSPDIHAFKPFSLDVEKMLSATRQLAEGIHALHESGKLHRDLKPPNVLVDEDGRVVILDFGMVADLTPSSRRAIANAPSDNGVPILGTPLYMSPEQTGSTAVTEASDWYSFGVMLFEAMTGTYPVDGDTMVQLLLRKHTTGPPKPERFPDGSPPELVELCCELLDPDPKARPSGESILRRLGVGSANIWSDSRADFLEAPPFVGRAEQLKELDRALFDMRHAKTPQVINIIGPSGIGKTCVATEFFDRIGDEVMLLDGKCYENESVPYKAVDSVIDHLAESLKNEQSPSPLQLVEGDLDALVRLFPVLRRIPAIRDMVRDEDDDIDKNEDSALVKRRAIATLRALLHELCEMSDVVLFIDDVQWGDRDSAQLLNEVFKSPGAPPLMLVTTYRDNHADSVFITEFRAALVEHRVETRDLVLSEFSEQEARDLITQVLGEEPSSNSVELIQKEAKGSPFFIDTLARHTKASTSESSSLSDVLSDRIERLPEDARTLLEVISIAGQPIDRQVAREAAYIKADAPKSITLLRNERLITIKTQGSSQSFETYHDRIRETVRDGLEIDSRKRHHLRIGRLLERRDKNDWERLAFHFKSADEFEKAADYSLEAAKQAQTIFAFDRAARLYQEALALRNDWNVQQTKSIWSSLGSVHAHLARGSESAEAYLKAAESSDEQERVGLTSRAAEQMIRSGQFERGKALLYDVLRRVEAPTPSSDNAALAGIVKMKAQLWWRGLDFTISTQPLDSQLQIRLDTLFTAANLMATIDVKLGAYYQLVNVLESLDSGAPLPIMRSIALQAVHESTAPRTRHRAKPLLDQCETLVRDHDLGPNMESWHIFCDGFIDYMSGRMRPALGKFQRSAEVLEEAGAGAAWEIANCRFYMLFCQFPLGEFRMLKSTVSSLLTEAEEANDFMHVAGMRLWSYLGHLADDNPEFGLEQTKKGIESWTSRGFHLQHFWHMLGQTNTALYNGNGAAAKAAIDDDWSALKKSLLLETQVANAIALETRARACIGAGDLKSASKAVKKLESMKWEWTHGQVLHLRAEIANARGQKEVAIELYSQADVASSNADLSHWAAASRFRLGELVGGERGDRICQEACDVLAAEEVVAPEKMIRMLAPA